MRRIRLVRRIACGIAALALIYHASSRWNAKVAAEATPDVALTQIEAEIDQFERLLDAAPQSVVFDGGKVRFNDLVTYDVLEPSSIMADGAHAYYWHPEVRNWLHDAARQAGRLPARRVAGAIDRRQNGMGGRGGPHNLAILGPRAGFQVDPASAWQGLLDAYDIAAMHDRHVRAYRATAPSLFNVLRDVAFHAHHYPLPPDQASRWIARIVADGLSLESALRTELNYDELDSMLDQHFTRDASGNGWMVLNRPEALVDDQFFLGSALPGVQSWRTSGFWNVFSPLFFDRATTRSLFQPSEQAISGCDDRPLDLTLFEPEKFDPRLRSPRLGPLRARVSGMQGWELWPTVHAVAIRRGVVTIFAIEAFRTRTGEYPEELADIEADVPALALRSPVTSAAFTYERKGDDYELTLSPGDATAPGQFRIHAFGPAGSFSSRRPTPAECE